MISVAEARETILRRVRRTGAERVRIADALGRTLIDSIVAKRAQPPFRASAMDGYAVRSADTPGVLRLAGEASAGRACERPVNAGECVRIFTGAPLPDGADAVLIQEDAMRDGDTVEAPPVATGRHVRAAGTDFKTGDELVAARTVLDPARIALTAAAGCADVVVARRPVVALLGGGDEIVPPGTVPRHAQIFDSATYGAGALLQAWGGVVRRFPPFADDIDRITEAVKAAVAHSDLTVVIGGASVGDHDHARSAMKTLGADTMFEKVSIRPGKPTWFALINDKPVLGLPGNPASAFVCAHVFLHPLIMHMLGRDPAPVMSRARLRQPLGECGQRETYLRARRQVDDHGQIWAEVAADQDSSLLTVMAASDCLLVRAPGAGALAAGDDADLLLL